jgi:hypothetical protein
MTPSAEPSASGISMPDKVVAIDRALAAAKVPHAIGGAIALAYYAEPRATVDVNISVFVTTDRWPDIRTALADLGVDVGVDESALARDGQVRVWWGRNPIDLFFSCDPLHGEMANLVRRVPFGDAQIAILAAEHLAVRTALLDRPKDWVDIEEMLVTEPLDLDAIRSWLTRMVGPDDERLEKLEALVTRLEL